MTARLANLLIAGVTKAGTTSLFAYLTQHPEVCGSSIKETEYFSPLLYPGRSLAPRADYERYFRKCGSERYVLEATPNYWYGGPRLLDATEEMLEHPRYVISLRDPVDRFWSELTYMQSKALLPVDLSAEEYLDRCLAVRAEHAEFTEANRYFRTVSTGFYAPHVAAWSERLGQRLRVVFFEDLVADAPRVVADLFGWLGLDAGDLSGYDFALRNTTRALRSAPVQRVVAGAAKLADGVLRRRPGLKERLVGAYDRVNRRERRQGMLDDATRDRLEAVYAPANEALRASLRAAGYQDLPAWLAPN